MTKLFYLLFIFFFFFNVNANEQKDFWYNKKIDNTKIFLYEKGVGNSKQEAINNALDKFYSNFIQYSDIYTIDFDYIFYNNEYIKTLHNELNKKNINLHIIEKYDYIDGQYYILLSFKRKEVFEYYFNELEYVHNKINLLYEKLKCNNVFASYSIKNLLKIYINLAKKLTSILYNLNKFNTKKYWDEYEKIEKYINQYIYSIDLKANNDKFPFVENNVKNILLKENIRIKDNSENMLLVNIVNNRKKIDNYYIVDFGINLYLKHNGQNINYKYINFVEKSEHNYNEIYEKIEQKVNEFFNKHNTLILLFK